MIENWITQERIIEGEPGLDDYLRSDEIDYEKINAESFDEYLNDVKNQRVDLRRLGKRLSLQTSATKTAVYTGTISTIDRLERRRLIIDATAITGTAVFLLEGTDDETTYYTVKNDIQFNSLGKHVSLIPSIYQYYRLSLVSIGTTITYSAFLYETTFDFPLLFLIRSRIYHTRYLRNGDDAFKEKSEHYYNKYQKLLIDTHYFYDTDDSGDISDSETETTPTQVTFRL